MLGLMCFEIDFYLALSLSLFRDPNADQTAETQGFVRSTVDQEIFFIQYGLYQRTKNRASRDCGAIK